MIEKEFKLMPTVDAVKVDELKGKKVLSNSGHEIGDVKSVLLNKKSMEVEGIRVDKGFFKQDFFIGKNYIKSFGEKGVMLNITPVDELKNMKVFDKEGEEIGKVKDVKRDEPTNNLVSLVVDRGMGNEDLIIARKEISAIGENILIRSAVA